MFFKCQKDPFGLKAMLILSSARSTISLQPLCKVALSWSKFIMRYTLILHNLSNRNVRTYVENALFCFSHRMPLQLNPFVSS